jgi:DNA methylase
MAPIADAHPRELSRIGGTEAQAVVRRPAQILTLSRTIEARLIEAARDRRPVEGLTHKHYRYPARFSPRFVAEAIQTFTAPGDLVGDIFVGGGTSVVEALAANRRSFGTDISTLATFVSKAKTLLPGEAKLHELERWLPELSASICMAAEEPQFTPWAEAGYMRNMGTPSRWRLRKAISQAVATIEGAAEPDLEMLARCIVLRTAHWALDGRKRLPSVSEFRHALSVSGRTVTDGARELARQVGADPLHPLILNRSAVGLEYDPRVLAVGSPRLIVTSPPYPGVHVLYHRWQVDGRKETPAPFFIANAHDGSGAAYYTLGDRKAAGLRGYFEQLEAALRSAAAIAGNETMLIQVVAFAQPQWQLPAYLATAGNAGWTEIGLRSLQLEGDGRLWRAVPNRKWHANRRGETGGAREVVLFHRKQGC